MSEHLSELNAALGRFHREGGTGNRLVVSRGPAWFVLNSGRGEPQARCHAATQKLLGDELRITPDGVVALRMAGFARAPQERALSRHLDIATEQQRAELPGLFQSWLDAVYGLDESHETHVSLSLGERPVLENERVHQAIRVLAKNRTAAARQAVYRALLKAHLSLVVDAAGEPAPFGSLQGSHTYAVFTSVAEADLSDPRGHNTEVLPGWAIFPRLHALTPGSLQINPDGRLGGELYRNEIEALANAAANYRPR